MKSITTHQNADEDRGTNWDFTSKLGRSSRWGRSNKWARTNKWGVTSGRSTRWG